MNDAIAIANHIDTDSLAYQDECTRILLNGGNGRYYIQWDDQSKTTSMGGIVFFAQYLNASGLFDRLCEDVPLEYSSNNAPKNRDVLGTLLLSILNGHRRYEHISTLRNDKVGCELLGLSKIVSEDSVRRALERGSEEDWDGWLTKNERAVYEALLYEDYIADIDSTVKPIYGEQEGAENGYNPRKPGRPSHNFHSLFVGSIRIVLNADVLPGKKHSGSHGMPGVWQTIDSLPPKCRPSLLRGDIGYGNQKIMLAAEERGQAYLFKLRKTSKVKDHILALEKTASAWSDAGDGWQGAERMVKLSGWSKARRCIFLRRPKKKQPKCKSLGEDAKAPEFDFVEHLAEGPSYEYAVLITNRDYTIVEAAQLYRDRADCENVFDEIKNQWGWSGFVTQDLKRCRIVARLIALVYNWWNVFTRLARPDQHMEAATSRPLLLRSVARLVESGRQKKIRISSTHACSDKTRSVMNRMASFFNKLCSTAEQLTAEEKWVLILSVAFVKWLRGRMLKPLADGQQMLLYLTS
jgi:hypothetical protein